MENNLDISDSYRTAVNFLPITLIHELSDTEYYIGISNNGNFTDRNCWQIRKIVKNGSVWETTLYPDGSQLSLFKWDDRLTYIYL
jgi:hypothetical protein